MVVILKMNFNQKHLVIVLKINAEAPGCVKDLDKTSLTYSYIYVNSIIDLKNKFLLVTTLPAYLLTDKVVTNVTKISVLAVKGGDILGALSNIKLKIGALENIYLGCMYSGKSDALVRYLTINVDIGLKVVYVNSVLDKRKTENGNSSYTTHSSSGSMSNKINTIKTDYLSKVDVSGYDVVGVDEFHLFKDDDPTSVVRDWVLKKGKRVSVSGLDGDFKIKTIGKIFDLIPLCESGGLHKMTGARCVECMKKGKIRQAGYSKKTTKDAKIIDVGGKDKYIAVCLRCHCLNL